MYKIITHGQGRNFDCALQFFITDKDGSLFSVHVKNLSPVNKTIHQSRRHCLIIAEHRRPEGELQTAYLTSKGKIWIITEWDRYQQRRSCFPVSIKCRRRVKTDAFVQNKITKSRHEPSRPRTALMHKERDSGVGIPALVL